MDKTNCTIDDCKLFINHDGKCKTEYDFWINKEKLREKFKKEIINEYKEKLIKYLENKIENDGYRSASNDSIYYSLIKKINNQEFD
ncbi:hypothetical protein [Spiroplasma endosymbiont of Tricholauxania praeusta]|uniref:hypothetical protein n=1 Tax=Spiroplasma endosymbiont of Tricholauxania praeusta TaxID=3066296 RepID=UPI0030D5E160